MRHHMTDFTQSWIETLARVSASTIVSAGDRHPAFAPVTLDAGVLQFRRVAANRTTRGGRIILIGNGGSLAIAMHLATDFALAGWPSIAFGDPVALTSHTNDFGSEANFTKQFELIKLSYADMVVAMSCSGK